MYCAEYNRAQWYFMAMVLHPDVALTKIHKHPVTALKDSLSCCFQTFFLVRESVRECQQNLLRGSLGPHSLLRSNPERRDKHWEKDRSGRNSQWVCGKRRWQVQDIERWLSQIWQWARKREGTKLKKKVRMPERDNDLNVQRISYCLWHITHSSVLAGHRLLHKFL